MVIDRLGKGSTTDASIVRALPTLYVLRCSADESVVRRVRTVVSMFRASRSVKIKWHLQKLMRLTDWTSSGQARSGP